MRNPYGLSKGFPHDLLAVIPSTIPTVPVTRVLVMLRLNTNLRLRPLCVLRRRSRGKHCRGGYAATKALQCRDSGRASAQSGATRSRTAVDTRGSACRVQFLVSCFVFYYCYENLSQSGFHH